MNKRNTNKGGNNFLQKLFPHAYDDDDVIQAEKEAAVAPTAAEHIDKSETETQRFSPGDDENATNATGGAAININVNGGEVHFHMDSEARQGSPSYHQEQNNEVIDVDYVDVSEPQVQLPEAGVVRTLSARFSPSSTVTSTGTGIKSRARLAPGNTSDSIPEPTKDELDFLDLQIEDANQDRCMEALLVEYFRDNPSISRWIRSQGTNASRTRWKRLPVSVKRFLEEDD